MNNSVVYMCNFNKDNTSFTCHAIQNDVVEIETVDNNGSNQMIENFGYCRNQEFPINCANNGGQIVYDTPCRCLYGNRKTNNWANHYLMKM